MPTIVDEGAQMIHDASGDFLYLFPGDSDGQKDSERIEHPLGVQIILDLDPLFDNIDVQHSAFLPSPFLHFQPDLFRLFRYAGIVLPHVLERSTMMSVVQVFSSVVADGVDGGEGSQRLVSRRF